MKDKAAHKAIEKLKPASTEKEYTVTYDDLPLSCPTRDMLVWNAHPRVYLPIMETGREVCPYCSSVFILKDFVAPSFSVPPPAPTNIKD